MHVKETDLDSHLKSVNVEINYSATIVQTNVMDAVEPCAKNVRILYLQDQTGLMHVLTAQKTMYDAV